MANLGKHEHDFHDEIAEILDRDLAIGTPDDISRVDWRKIKILAQVVGQAADEVLARHLRDRHELVSMDSSRCVCPGCRIQSAN